MLEVQEKSALGPEAIDELRSSLRGPLLSPGDPGYDQARTIWNAMIDKHPAAIVRASGVADVVASVNWAREHGALLSIRGGGHNVAGKAVCDGGLMLDLSQLKGIRVDPQTRTARVQPGITLGELDRETQLFGLVAPAGIVSMTGVAGLTLGGGFGWLTRKYGYTSDNLLSVDVVAADGTFLTASETENSDLFWGVRGGGGNFGVVTSFEYRLHPLGPTVVAGLALWPAEHALEVTRFYREFSRSAPDDLGTLLLLRLAPAAPFVPADLHGKPVVGIAVCYAGSVEEGMEVVRPIKEFGSPAVDMIGPKPFVTHQQLFDSGQLPGRNYYWKSEYLPDVSDEVINIALRYLDGITSPLSVIMLMQLGGAAARLDPNRSALSLDDAAYVLNINTGWMPPCPAAPHVEWARGFWSDVQPFKAGGIYVNFINADEGEDRVRAAYGPEKFARLAALKDKYDPTNLFRLNQNIAPSRL